MQFKLNITALSHWLPHQKPLIISGPCSAESEEQVMATARQIASLGLSTVFRAGIWKPRTRPNAFEGVGTIGLEWLKRVKAETGLLTSIEVANANHVEKALKAGIDILWIGARTTVNPFSVQEIADALKGNCIPVLIKNPVNPDLQLWIGALERVNRAGITKIAAIHRGFHAQGNNGYRNQPKWELAIELKMLCPELPIICDPSHICGNPSLIPSVSQKAMDLNMDGLMLETHHNPKAALSDAGQQITPLELANIINELTIREASAGDAMFLNKLEKLRCHIDRSDEEILMAIAQRMVIVKEIGEYKKENGVTILQIERWQRILLGQLESAEKIGLSRDFIKSLYQLIHDESIRMQTVIMNKKEEGIAG